LIAATVGQGCAASASIAAWKGWATSASASCSRPCSADQHAAGLDPVVQPRQQLGDRVEDVVVQRVSLRGVADADPRYGLGRLVEQKFSPGQLLGHQ
jgi:hypothetical protein